MTGGFAMGDSVAGASVDIVGEYVVGLYETVEE